MDCTISTSSSTKNCSTKKTSSSRKRKYATLESPQITRGQTLNDRSKISETGVQDTRSSETLDQDSTTIVEVSKPYWNEYTAEMSRKLWLPTKTDCVDMDSNSSSSSSRRLIPNSWFSVRESKNMTREGSLQTTSSQSATISWPRTMEYVLGENRKKRKQAQQEKETEAIKKANSSSRKGKEDTPVSESETEGNPYEVVRDDEVDL